MKAQALWTISNGVADIRSEQLTEPGPDEAVVRSLWSGISRGTERLVFAGKVPAAEYERMRAPMMGGNFPFPVKYGYAAVGLVEKGPSHLEGRTVFCLHPHQDRFIAPVAMLAPVPKNVPTKRATLTANMETALNGVWDSGAGPSDTIVIVGAGIVGLLIAAIVAAMPGTDVTVIDVNRSRAHQATQLGARFAVPSEAPKNSDVVFHASVTPQGLATAIGCAGNEARIVELSWYGSDLTPVPLGGAFHSQRLQLVSSQVGQIAQTRRPRWDYARRRDAALALLADERLDCLITEEVAFSDLPATLPRIFAPGAPGLQTVVRY